MKAGYTLVHDQKDEKCVEVLYLPNKKRVQLVRNAGGVLFETPEAAKEAARGYNFYSADSVVANAMKAGFFSTKRVSGRHIFVPKVKLENAS